MVIIKLYNFNTIFTKIDFNIIIDLRIIELVL